MPENNSLETQEQPANAPLTMPAALRAAQCSVQICANGHHWTPQLALPGCQGCHTPLLALRMANCPICNEPATHTRLRIDHLGGAHPLTKRCQNEYHTGPEYIIVTIDHTHTNWCQSTNINQEATQYPKTVNQQVYPLKVAPAVSESQDAPDPQG